MDSWIPFNFHSHALCFSKQGTEYTIHDFSVHITFFCFGVLNKQLIDIDTLNKQTHLQNNTIFEEYKFEKQKFISFHIQ